MSPLLECTARRGADGAIAVSVGERDVTVPSPPGTVTLRVEQSLLDARQLAPVPGGPWPSWCSLVGRIAEPSAESSRLAPGTRVAAIAPACNTVAVAEERCFALPSTVDTRTSAHWALLHVLLAVVRSTPIELGHWVLIHGGGLTGRILAALAWASGAFAVGIDPRLGEPAGAAGTWVRGLGEARFLLPRDGTDVLIDLSSGNGDHAELLAAVRTGGRAILAGGPQTIDLDLYPDVHRRSLRVCGFGLDLCPDASRGAGDAEFLRHVLDTGRIVLAEPDVSTSAARLQSSPLTVRDHANSVLVEWIDGPD